MTHINRRRFPILLASALALLAILGALFLPDRAQAQTATVLVSSVGQPVNDKAGVNQDNSLGQAFSIAAGSGNYTLTSIEISLTNDIAAADIGSLSVSVWSTDSSGLPSASLHTLANPASITADTTATFNAQSGATLEAGNTYAVLVSYDKNPTLIPQWSYTESGAFDARSRDRVVAFQLGPVEGGRELDQLHRRDIPHPNQRQRGERRPAAVLHAEHGRPLVRGNDGGRILAGPN